MSGLRLLGLLGVAAALVLAFPALAGAHAFLVRTSPQAGERLTSSPSALTLQFSGSIVPGSEELSVRTPQGAAVEVGPGELLNGATALRTALPPAMGGVYVVSWRVLAEDGHVSLGEFAFGVGSGGQLPGASATASTPISWPDVGGSWLLLVGLAIALGGLGSETFVWRPVARQHDLEVPRAPVVLGLLLALVGVTWQSLLLAGAQAGGGGVGGLDPRAWRALLATRPGLLSAAALVLLAYALWLLPLPRLRASALLPLAGAVGVIAFRGHSGTSGTWWAAPANAMHLVAAGLWIGALLHLVIVLWRMDREGYWPALGEAARRYAGLAFGLVLVALAGGTATALAEFTRPAELLETTYGRVLLFKLLLVMVALALALAARRRGLPANPGARLSLLRRLTRVEGAVLLAVVGLSALLVNVAPPRIARATEDLLGPAPLSGPVVRLASLAGQLAVYLAAADGQLEVQVVAPSAQRAPGAEVQVEVRTPTGEGASLYPRPCGQGCFTMRFPWPEGLTRLTARVSAPGWPGGTVRFDVPWPAAPEEPELLDRVIAAMRAQPQLVLTEQTFSGPGATGPRNTVRLSGAEFMALEPYTASGANDVRRLPGGSRLTELTLYLPGSYIWYRLWIDREYRLQRAVIVSPGHQIERSFFYGPPEGDSRRSVL
ncbi:MAG: copper resistance CopC/CopD family protein [Candidatus Methylomirabilales bacterium]